MRTGRTLRRGLCIAFTMSVFAAAGSADAQRSAAARPLASPSARVDLTLNPYVGQTAGQQSLAVVDQADDETQRERAELRAARARLQSSWYGPTGGIHVVDAATGLPGSVRLQLGFDYFRASDFLVAGDTNESVGGTLALSVTALDQLEIFAALRNHANSNNAGDPVLLQVIGDAVLGAKTHVQLTPWLALGGDLRLSFLNTVGDLGVGLDSTSLGLRAAATADLRRIDRPLPLLARVNVDYFLDNSAQLIDEIEDANYSALPPAQRDVRENEDAHLVSRIERFAFGINRVDMLTFGLGLEAPLQAARDFYVHPLLEWRLGVPINRQGYNCLLVPTDASIAGADGCLATEGLSAAPSVLTLGARVLPPVRGLSAFVGVDIGLLGTSTFVRELAPNRSWALLVSVGYAVDAQAPAGEVRIVEVVQLAPAPTPPDTRVRVQGLVVEQGSGVAIEHAAVRYPGRALSPQLTNDNGRFVSYALDPGELVLEISHPEYEPRTCTSVVTPPRPVPADAAPASAPGPARSAAPGDRPDASAAATGESAPALQELRCELVARPREGRVLGSVRSDKGEIVSGAAITLEGPVTRTLSSDAQGAFVLEDLPAGQYSVRVDAPAHLLRAESVSVAAGADIHLPIILTAKPKSSLVVMTPREVRIRKQVMFRRNSADIDERSAGLLSEIADVLLRNPQVRAVQVQGHTDNSGDPQKNMDLSQRRAEAVMQRLVAAGVAPERLSAKGYGDTRPLVPNLTAGNRARNRRVQLIIEP